MKKYVFVGSHGTGKSSAATYLAAIMKENNPKLSIKVIEENVREIVRIVDGDLNSPSFQKLCMVDHLAKEFMYEQLYDIVICDRTALDTLVYGLVYEIKLPSEYFSLALNHLNTFDKVFFVRPDSDFIADDGFRDTNIEIRTEIDKQFERMLKLWGGNYETITTKDIFKYNYLGVINNE